jgi:hypothetical protein
MSILATPDKVSNLIDVDDVIKPPPRAGTGLHPWLFGQACKLKDIGATPEEAAIYIRASLDKHEPGREVFDRELNEAVRNAFLQAERPGAIAWPNPKAKDIKAIVEREGAFTLERLKRCSPHKSLENLTAENAIGILFPGNPLLCLAASQWDAQTLEREMWRGREGNLQFIVPSPMVKPFGVTQDERKSSRCLDNVGPRRFLVVECDMSPESGFWGPLVRRWEKKDISIFDAQAALLVNLATNPGLRIPLACVVHSGNKSLQGWYYVQGFEDERVLPFFQRAVGLGADRATWTRCQLVRLPGGLRENGNRQEVVYLNPAVLIRKEGSANGSN